MIETRPSPARIVAIVATLLALALGLILFSKSAPAQGAANAPAVMLVLRGADTLVAERISYGAGSLQAEITVRGGPRISYRIEIAEGVAVPYLALQQYGPGTPADAAPVAGGTVRLTADSLILELTTGGGMQRSAKSVTGWPLPTIGNDFALTEILIARAKRSAPAPYTGKVYAIAGTGTVLVDANVQLIGTDSAVVTIAGGAARYALDANGRITGGTIAAAGLTIARVSGAAANKVSLGWPNYGAPLGAPYSAEEVVVQTRAGHVLSGTLTLPLGASGPVPAVVTITGSGQQDRDESISIVAGFRPFRQVADTLGRRGIAVLRLDDRGVNGSGGDLVSATTADFADDIRAGVAYLRARKEIDGERIGLFGHSEGGMIGPMVAATDAKLAALVIAAGPAYTGRRIINFQLSNLVRGNSSIPADKKDSAIRVSLAAFDSSAARSPWTLFFLTYDPIETLKKVKTPTLVMQGGTDQQVTPEQAPLVEKALREGGNRNVTLRVFENRNHLFLDDPSGFPGGYPSLRNTKIGPEVLGPLADWLAMTLKAPPTKP
jgi:dienelactone hydrolase